MAVPLPKEFSAKGALKSGDMSGRWLLRHPVLTGDSKREIKIVIEKEAISDEGISSYRLQRIEESKKISNSLGLEFPDLIAVIPGDKDELPALKFFYLSTQSVTKIDENGNEVVSLLKIVKPQYLQIKQVDGKTIYFANDSNEKRMPDDLKLEWIGK